MPSFTEKENICKGEGNMGVAGSAKVAHKIVPLPYLQCLDFFSRNSPAKGFVKVKEVIFIDLLMH